MTDVPELAKKSSVCWLEAEGRIWPLWHEWVGTAEEGAVCVVGSVGAADGRGSEQPIPDVVDGTMVSLLLRGKADRALAARVEARVEIIGPGSAAWEPTTSALKAGRLNLEDGAAAIDRWARDCRVLRLVPLGAVAAADLPSDMPHTLPRLS